MTGADSAQGAGENSANSVSLLRSPRVRSHQTVSEVVGTENNDCDLPCEEHRFSEGMKLQYSRRNSENQ